MPMLIGLDVLIHADLPLDGAFSFASLLFLGNTRSKQPFQKSLAETEYRSLSSSPKLWVLRADLCGLLLNFGFLVVQLHSTRHYKYDPESHNSSLS